MLAGFMAASERVTAERALALGWRPHRPSMIEEIERGSYAGAIAAGCAAVS
jgi:hypothetical protein